LTATPLPTRRMTEGSRGEDRSHGRGFWKFEESLQAQQGVRSSNSPIRGYCSTAGGTARHQIDIDKRFPIPFYPAEGKEAFVRSDA
jgi:hypothetical protein